MTAPDSQPPARPRRVRRMVEVLPDLCWHDNPDCPCWTSRIGPFRPTGPRPPYRWAGAA